MVSTIRAWAFRRDAIVVGNFTSSRLVGRAINAEQVTGVDAPNNSKDREMATCNCIGPPGHCPCLLRARGGWVEAAPLWGVIDTLYWPPSALSAVATKEAEIVKLRNALQAIADDPDTNIEAAAYAKNTLAALTAALRTGD